MPPPGRYAAADADARAPPTPGRPSSSAAGAAPAATMTQQQLQHQVEMLQAQMDTLIALQMSSPSPGAASAPPGAAAAAADESPPPPQPGAASAAAGGMEEWQGWQSARHHSKDWNRKKLARAQAFAAGAKPAGVRTAPAMTMCAHCSRNQPGAYCVRLACKVCCQRLQESDPATFCEQHSA